MATPLTRTNIATSYRELLGRDPDENEYGIHLGNPGGYEGFRDAVYGSGEYRDRGQATGREGAAQPSLSSLVGPRPQGGSYGYTGFDFTRAQDTTRSAKDSFAQGSLLADQQGAGTAWHTKAGAQQWATQYLKPYLESQGYQVLEIVGDKMRIVTREDREAGNAQGSWVDFVKNADGAAEGLTPELAWQVESGVGGGYVPIPGATPLDPYRPAGGGTTSPGISPEAYERLTPEERLTWEDLVRI